MKIVCFSDTHTYPLNEFTWPEADVLVCAGDICNTGEMKDLHIFLDHITPIMRKYKHFIPVAVS